MSSTDTRQRLLSLDAFRGATIAAMILVNNPGGGESYAQLEHAAWSGWTMTDMIFPFFLMIMGVSMQFSFARRMEEGKKNLDAHVLRRGAMLIALGILLNGFPFFDLATVRFPGVLQRIGVCYVVAGFLVLHSPFRWQVGWAVGVSAVYWAAMKLIPVPGYGSGVLQPVGNLCWYIDSSLFAGHTWAWAPAPGFDPEGLLSTLPSITTTMIGVFTGRWLRGDRPKEEKTVWMFVAGFALVLVGVVCDMWLPINKNLWTPSFAAFMGGWGLVCLAMFYWIIDVKNHAGWAKPFVIFGMNAIAMYVFSELLAVALWMVPAVGPTGARITLHDVVFTGFFAPLADPRNSSLLFALVFVLLCYLLSYFLWRKRWFIRI
jgi:predicted acyltransferase